MKVFTKAAVMIFAALAIMTGLATPADAAALALPGQPNGIPAGAWSNQWRPSTGNLCAEDWTGNYDGKTAAAIQHAAAQISASSDWNVAYGGAAGCEANGYTNANKITFVMNHGDPDPVAGQHLDEELVWTGGGYRVGGYVATRMIVHMFSQDVDWYSHLGATKRLATMNLVRVLGFRDPLDPNAETPECTITNPHPCRLDTILATDVQRIALTGWDYDRLALTAPWGVTPSWAAKRR